MRRIADKERAAHFWSKVDHNGQCWLWQPHCKRNGYGQYYIARRALYAHRVAWELVYGPIPAGLFVLHRCDVPACVRPTHLFLGTNQTNTDDAIAKGRKPCGERAPGARLTAGAVAEIRARYRSGGVSQYVLAREFGMSQSQISDIVRGNKWKAAAAILAAAQLTGE